MLESEVVAMFPQIPAKLPPAITKSRDVAELIMSGTWQSTTPPGR
jgi:hypothetical protein